MEILKTSAFFLSIIIVIYGIIKKNRLLFNYGYLIVGLLIIIDQIIIYMSSFDPLNLALISLWLVQVVLVIPNKLPPLTRDGSVIAKSAIPKIMVSLSIINFFGAYYASTSIIGSSFYISILAYLTWTSTRRLFVCDSTCHILVM